MTTLPILSNPISRSNYQSIPTSPTSRETPLAASLAEGKPYHGGDKASRVVSLSPSQSKENREKAHHHTWFEAVAQKDWKILETLCSGNTPLDFLTLNRPLVTRQKVNVYALEQAIITSFEDQDFCANAETIVNTLCPQNPTVPQYNGRNGLTALLWAEAPLEVVKDVLDNLPKDLREALLKTPDEAGSLPLILSIRLKRTDLVDYFLSIQAPIDGQDKNGDTALIEAMRQEDLTLVNTLLKNQANPFLQNARKYDALSVFLVRFNRSSTQEEILDILLTYCANCAEKIAPQKKKSFFVANFYYSIIRNLPMHIIEKILKTSGLSEEYIFDSTYGKEMGTIMHGAAVAGNLEFLKTAVNKGFSLDEQDAHEETPLHWAAADGILEVIRFILSVAPELANTKSKHDQTPFDLARMYGHVACVKALLPKTIKAKEKEAWLLDAVLRGHKDLVAYWVEIHHISPEIVGEHGKTLLHKAAKNGHLDVFKYIFKHLPPEKRNIDSKDHSGQTPLFYAVLEGRKKMAEMLLSKPFRADPLVKDKSGRNFAHSAILSKRTNLLRYILPQLPAETRKNLLNTPDRSGDTPTHFAIQNNFFKMAHFLVKNDGGPNIVNEKGQTFLHRMKPYPLMIMLLHYCNTNQHKNIPLDVNIQDHNGNTPLHLISPKDREYEALVSYFIQMGFKPNLQNNKGETVLHKLLKNALSKGKSDVLDALLKAGADLNIQDDTGETPLHKAAKKRNKKTIAIAGDTLLEEVSFYDYLMLELPKTANLSLQNNKGKTPYYYATRQGQTHLHPLEHKPEWYENTKAKNGRTPKDIVQRKNGEAPFPTLSPLPPGYPLHSATHAGDQKRIKEMLHLPPTLKPDINAKDPFGNTPLHYAILAQNQAVIDLLVKRGGNLNVQNDEGRTPLHLAALQPGKYTYKDTFFMWLSKQYPEKIDLLIKDKKGKTPMYLYARSHPEKFRNDQTHMPLPPHSPPPEVTAANSGRRAGDILKRYEV